MANTILNKLVFNKYNETEARVVRLLLEEGMAYFKPRPRYLEDTVLFTSYMDNAFPLWWLWSKDNWGTKWDIYEGCRHIENCSFYYNTANEDNAVFIDWLNEELGLRLTLYSCDEMDIDELGWTQASH